MPPATDIDIFSSQEEMLRMTVLENPYIPIVPSIPQAQFLMCLEDEALYGGAAGGGKSIALLAASLQFVMVPDYHALILRRSFPDLNQPGALIPLSFEWLSETDAEWNQAEKRWYFPSGATLTFGHMNTEKDRFNYQGAAYSFIGFDELTQFLIVMYTYLFSRIRRGNDGIPARMRAASNPGGDGHDWVKTRFLSTAPNRTMTIFDEEIQDYATRIFIPAKLSDNPHLDQKSYVRRMGMLDPVTRAQLLRGDWDILPEGNMFKREWFAKVLDAAPTDIVSTIRAWDLAATPPTPENPDPDWTCGCKMSRTARNTVVIHDVRRMRGTPGDVQAFVAKTAAADGKGVAIRIEQEPGASGKTVVYNYANQVLPGYDVRSIMPTGDKVVRAGPLSAAAERGDVELMRGAWNSWWLDNVVPFPGMKHDDPVDAPAHGFNALMEHLVIEVPNGPIDSVYA